MEELYDVDLEHECRTWMESVTGEQFPEADPEVMNEIDKDIKGKEFHVALKDGVYLLKYVHLIIICNGCMMLYNAFHMAVIAVLL